MLARKTWGRGWKPGKHLWLVYETTKGPDGATVYKRRCRLCGMESTNQSFSRARTPWCYEQQEIDFEARGLYDRKQPHRQPEWVVSADGGVTWL